MEVGEPLLHAGSPVTSLVEVVRQTGAAVAFSDRRIVLADGTLVERSDTGDVEPSHAVRV